MSDPNDEILVRLRDLSRELRTGALDPSHLQRALADAIVEIAILRDLFAEAHRELAALARLAWVEPTFNTDGMILTSGYWAAGTRRGRADTAEEALSRMLEAARTSEETIR